MMFEGRCVWFVGKESCRGRAESQFPVCVCVFSHVQLFATTRTGARQAPLSIGLSRQEYGSRLPFLSPGSFPNPGIEPVSPTLAGGTLVSKVNLTWEDLKAQRGSGSLPNSHCKKLPDWNVITRTQICLDSHCFQS